VLSSAAARSGQTRAGASFGDAVIETVEDLQKAVGDFERSESWSRLQPVAFRLLGQYSFGLGVVYGIGETSSRAWWSCWCS
jgi:hypothetical protein